MSLIATSSFVFLSSAKYVSPVPPGPARQIVSGCFATIELCQKKGKQKGDARSEGAATTLAKLLLEFVVIFKPQAGRLLLLRRVLLLRRALFGDIFLSRGGSSAPHALTARGI